MNHTEQSKRKNLAVQIIFSIISPGPNRPICILTGQYREYFTRFSFDLFPISNTLYRLFLISAILYPFFCHQHAQLQLQYF